MSEVRGQKRQYLTISASQHCHPVSDFKFHTGVPGLFGRFDKQQPGQGYFSGTHIINKGPRSQAFDSDKRPNP